MSEEFTKFTAQTFAALRQLCKKRNENEAAGFEAVFRGLASVGRGQSTDAASLEQNKSKNRYLNILAYDASRVVLNLPDGRDYINASWCKGAAREKQYIASQGPVPDSFEEFWWMVWTTKTPAIVMTTREVEKNVLKCHRYWPESDIKAIMVGKALTVHHVETVNHRYHIERTLKIVHKPTNSTHIVTQLCYLSWPDHGVPLTTTEFLEFRAAVNNIWHKDPQKPLLVHCSAGVGRTGTYIACDRALNMLQDQQPVDLDDIVKDLRQARNYMVQTVSQFVFVHKVIMDALRNLLITQQALLEKKQMEEAARRKAEEERRKLEQEKAEEEAEAKQVLQGKEIRARVVEVPDEEFKQAEAEWRPQAAYDVERSMSGVESTYEALHALGVDVEKAAVEHVINLVRQAKQRRQAQKAAEEEAKRKEEEAKVKAELEKERQAKEAAKQAVKNQASSKAERFMRKLK
eukprot:TRINITY_DN11441_c0_g1_i1.p1 TRINITY_DN11441_c0_g1~~TRINITY_DN11441_c0_g1_i1.p1  ORF type:complete len:461 (+),score=138.90 TRINITY_DN11441_c0_g1_i1:77-1459(+)